MGIEDELRDAHLKLGDILFLQCQYEEAHSHFSRAMDLGADRTRCLMGSGLSLMGLERPSEALSAFRAVDPDAPRDVRCLVAINSGACLAKIGDAPGCLESMESALGLFGEVKGPIRVALGGLAYLGSRYLIHFTMGTAHCMLGDFASAVRDFEAALEDEAGGVANGLNVDLAKVELAYCRMKIGLVDARAWELHERRWWTGRPALQRMISPPANFSDPAGRTVMVYSEQGYGDSIQFSRFIRGLKGAGASRVVLVTHQPLARLFKGLEGVDEVAVSGQRHSLYDLHVPIMSLPHVLNLGGDLESYSSPYLGVEEADALRWASELPRGIKVGLVWAGDPKKEHPDHVQEELRRRNIPLRSLLPSLLEASEGLDVHFVSLQKEDRGGELADFPSVANPMVGVTDYYDTACVVANLDIVVAVDTSVAHLAAAMGKPVWMFSRYRGCWRWGSEGACLAKRWYPSVRIWRETEYDNWGPVISAAAAEFRPFLEGIRA